IMFTVGDLKLPIVLLVLKVAGQNDNGPPVKQPVDVRKRLTDIRSAALGIGREQLTDQTQYVQAPLFGRNYLLNPISKQDESHLVSILYGTECQHGTQLN